jgi:hypothetical protein
VHHRPSGSLQLTANRKSGTKVRILEGSGTRKVRGVTSATGEQFAALLILSRKNRRIFLIRHSDDGLLFRGREAE